MGALDHYVDIDVLPDPDFPVNQVLAALYAKLHRALVAGGSADIGVSFPGADARAPHLGRRLRLHGGADALAALMARDWLTGVRDHVTTTAPQRVPDGAVPYAVRRVQAKSNVERLRRRQMRRHGLSEEAARERIPDGAAQVLDLPFLEMRSASTGQTFRLFVSQLPAGSAATGGEFNAFGMSATVTLPWF